VVVHDNNNDMQYTELCTTPICNKEENIYTQQLRQLTHFRLARVYLLPWPL